ncbi:MAG: response regulator transcription factor [Candidatus Tectomicrobia bacterium]|nr:response regulator transcription factor [Candidatus Tectomicrobia bacterium]
MNLGEQSRIRILIADDHPVVREGLRSMLFTVDDMQVVGEASTGAEAVSQARVLQPDVVLLDVRMPDGTGLTVLDRVKAGSPGSSVIVLTMHDNPDYISRAIKSGAAGYVLKEVGRQDLLTAIRTVVQPSAAPTPLLLSKSQRSVVDASQVSTSDDVPSLSPVERELLLLMSEGLNNKEISEQLRCSLGTVKNYLQHIFSTLQVSDRTRAVVEAIRLGLIDP